VEDEIIKNLNNMATPTSSYVLSVQDIYICLQLASVLLRPRLFFKAKKKSNANILSQLMNNYG
jgi:hypothetical protein